MNADLLLAQFDRIADAPDAVPCLRRFILDLAVRGKLVEQDPKDEPAAGLLKRIDDEKARALKAGEIKRLEAFELVAPSEIAFAIPAGWEVVRMGSLARKLGAGSTPLGGKTVYQSEGVPFLRSQNVHNDGLRLDDVALIARTTHDQMSGTHVQKQDVLLNITGASIGRCALVPSTFVEGNVSQHVAIIRLFLPTIRAFIHLSLISPFFQKVINDVQVGVSREGLSMQSLRVFPMLLPPLAEQHRIVAKVDELMALCDRLEAAQKERESRRDRLTAASLHRLNQPAAAGDSGGADDPAAAAQAFRHHSRFTLDHLPRLTTRPEHVDHLRQTILNIAVRGKLVHQTPKDDPAAELLKQIDAEKAQLVENRQIRADKFRPFPASEEFDFHIPAGWATARLSHVILELQTGPFGSSLHQSDYREKGIPVVNPACIKNERIVPIDRMAVAPETVKRLETFTLRKGDVVLGRRGEMGRCAQVTEKEDGWLCGTGCLILRLPSCVYPRFFVMLIGSPMVRRFLGGSAVGMIMQSLNQTIMMNMPVGIPPLAEQHRIVAKVDELMVICDRLEAQLTTTQTESRRLLEAVLHEALHPANETMRAASEVTGG